MNIAYLAENKVILFFCQSEKDIDSIKKIIWRVFNYQAQLGNVVFDFEAVFEELEKDINTPIPIPTEPLSFIMDIIETMIANCKDQNMKFDKLENLLNFLKYSDIITNTKH